MISLDNADSDNEVGSKICTSLLNLIQSELVANYSHLKKLKMDISVAMYNAKKVVKGSQYPMQTPGPASSVEDRSLCNISPEGTAVRISPRTLLFSRNFFA